jgi:NhaP-type Na+/H+ or K+/H+ antiporter
MSTRVMRVAFSVAVMAALAAGQHDDAGAEDPTEPEPEPDCVLQGHSSECAGEGQHGGGHSGDLWKTQQCVPIACGEDSHATHGDDTREAIQGGCRDYQIFNFMKGETENISITCQGCVPHTCGFGEHDCVPTVCHDEHGEAHGGHASDPCAGGHHSDDGLTWWPFLLVCLISTVAVTTFLGKLGNGACCGKSLNPPFTVVMFFFGYMCSALAVHDDLEELRDGMDEHHILSFTEIIFDSVVSWKGAHPHVILFVLLPPLLFEDASGMDYYVFRKVLMSSILLAGPGVGLSMGLTAATTMLLFGFAEECVVEIDPHTKEQIVSGAKEYTKGVLTGTTAETFVCDPMNNPDWQNWEDAQGGHPCIECTESAYKSEQLPVAVHLLLGGMLAATDPVAVCAVLNDLGCPDKLNFMIAGESLLNDGTAVVAFLVMQSVAGGCDTSAAKVMISLIRLAGGGVLWGMFMAAMAYNFIKHLRDPNIEITTLVFCTMTCFWVAENVIMVSGVLGTVVFGVQTARTSFLAMDEHTHHANHAFWGEVGYVATSAIFILAGVKSRDKIASFLDNFAEDFDVEHRAGICAAFNPDCDLANPKATGAWYHGESACADDAHERTEAECITHHVCLWKGHTDLTECDVGETCCVQAEISGDDEFHLGNQLGLNLVLWFILTFIRAFVVLVFSPILKNIGYGLTWKEAAVMVWGGLRGAVSLSLALLIDGNHLIGARAREMIFLQTTGIVTLTLVINGTTSGMVYKALQVYPANPFRPVLATQGLRNLQLEMDKFVTKLSGHWFHSNADQDALKKLMPNFSEAHMYDGDLVDVKMDQMHSVWTSTVTSGATVSPQRLTLQTAENIRGGIQAGVKLMRMGYNSKEAGDLGPSSAPDAYGEIVISKGAAYQTFETSVVKNSNDPEWKGANSKVFRLLPGSDPVELYIHMFDNDLGEVDEYIGQAKADITDEVNGKLSKQFTQELTVCDHAVKDREFDGKMPYEVCGSLSFEIKCGDDEVEVTLVSGSGIGGEGVKKGMAEEVAALAEGDHDHEHAHGHGHGTGHVTMLKNVRRWLDESKEDVEPTFAMYDVMLSTMKTSFLHELEGKIMSVAAFSKLNAAVGIALDLNNNQMEGSMAEKMEIASSEGASSATLSTWQRLKPDDWKTPVDAAVNHIIDFCDSGEAYIQHPAAFFNHRLLCAEMLLTLVDQLKQLSDVDLTELGDEFADNISAACGRAKVKLAEMQSLAPNTFRAVHTLIGFKVIAAEFHHRVHMYQDQGFFIDTLVGGCEFVMEGREHELQRYFNIDPLLTMLGVCTQFVCMKDHPVVFLMNQDQTGVVGSPESKVENPAADEEDADGDDE